MISVVILIVNPPLIINPVVNEIYSQNTFYKIKIKAEHFKITVNPLVQINLYLEGFIIRISAEMRRIEGIGLRE